MNRQQKRAAAAAAAKARHHVQPAQLVGQQPGVMLGVCEERPTILVMRPGNPQPLGLFQLPECVFDEWVSMVRLGCDPGRETVVRLPDGRAVRVLGPYRPKGAEELRAKG